MKKYFYITGTSSGLGKSIAEAAFESPDNFVYGFSRTQTWAHEHFVHKHTDLSRADDILSIQFHPHAEAGKIVLINNAGVSEINYLGGLDNDKIIEGYHVNVIAPHILINKFINTYASHQAEKLIISITSGAANSAYDGWSIYCATKAAINMITLCGEREQKLRDQGFRFFAIAPGVLDTHMQDKLRASAETEFSSVQRFIDLKENNQLIDPRLAAKKIIDSIENPAQLSGSILRLQL